MNWPVGTSVHKDVKPLFAVKIVPAKRDPSHDRQQEGGTFRDAKKHPPVVFANQDNDRSQWGREEGGLFGKDCQNEKNPGKQEPVRDQGRYCEKHQKSTQEIEGEGGIEDGTSVDGRSDHDTEGPEQRDGPAKLKNVAGEKAKGGSEESDDRVSGEEIAAPMRAIGEPAEKECAVGDRAEKVSGMKRHVWIDIEIASKTMQEPVAVGGMEGGQRVDEE